MEREYDIAERLINYASAMLDLVDMLPSTKVANHLAGQLIRSCTSPALNYAESEAAESPKDFVHKLHVALKELKECRIVLRLILIRKMIGSITTVGKNLIETEELIAILGKSISTATKNMYSKKKREEEPNYDSSYADEN
jgi:four helix bundle protein